MKINEPLTWHTPLRRYISHKKLLDLLENKRFFVSRIDVFKDQFEAEYTKQLCDAFSMWKIYSDDVLQKGGAHYWRDKILSSTYISCWTLNMLDNMALWRLYNGGCNNCVAIDVMLGDAIQLFDPQTQLLNVRAVKVEYIDHFSHDNPQLLLDENGLVDLPRIKNIGYAFEDEVRIIYSTANNLKVCKRHDINKHSYFDEKHLVISNINLESLIRKITISPDADDDYIEYIKALLEKFELDIPVELSVLKNPPRPV